MIRTLRLENYRSFERYELRDLARVNLLVGPNNCGKTSVLEAVQLLVSRGDPRVLTQLASRRGESAAGIGDDKYRVTRYPIYHQFHGHKIDRGTHLSISSDDGLGPIRMDIVEAEDGQEQDLFEIEPGAPQPLALRIRRGVRKDILLSLAEDGSFAWRRPGMRHPSLESSLTSPPSQFVTAESLQAHEMAVLWDQVVVAGRESEVLEAMRILEEDLDSIYFLTADTTGRAGGSPGIVLGFGPGAAPRVPIGSYGDGMRRLLALSLALVHTGGGFLLIDEIDTGLHWTVMEEMWKLVVEAAARFSIQVFATTHSFDCIIGLASLLKARPDLTDSVSIQKVERDLERSVGFDSDDIVTAADLDIELR